MTCSRRSGAALAMALLAIIVLNCIVLGTLHIALQEHRIGANRVAFLQLRLDAEGGARRALSLWTADIDSMAAGGNFRLAFPASATTGASVYAERLDDHLFLLESVAGEAAPRAGRAVARLLVRPPALSPLTDPAAAPISAAGTVRVTATGTVFSREVPGCGAVAPRYSILTPPFGVTIDPGGAVDAPAGPLGPRPLIGSFDRLAASARHLAVEGDSVISADADGVLIVRGNVTLTGDATFRGLLVVRDSMTIGPAAAVDGAVHTGAALTLQGRIRWDACAVEAAVRAVGLDRPAPAGPRAWLPAF
jgi:hypothetical protein